MVQPGALLLLHLRGLPTAPALQAALADRSGFRRFCGFDLEDAAPLSRFRIDLVEAGSAKAVLDVQLGRRGLVIKAGTMIDVP